MSLNSAKELIESIQNQIDATSCTFYLRDPLWSDELRLVAMPGVQFTEPMYGFSFPGSYKKNLTDSDLEVFSSDIEAGKQYHENIEFSLEGIEPQKRRLFGNFVEREGIKSSVKLIHRIDGYVEAVLFINYDTLKEFDDSLKEKIKLLFGQVIDRLPLLRDEICSPEDKNINQVVQLFSPTYASSKKIIYERDQPLEEYLHCLLLTLTESIPELKEDQGFGTMHIYEPETQTLRMIARSDNIEFEQILPSLSVLEGQGIVSWVAIRRQSLLINDLRKSAFHSIHSPVKQGTVSEIAIPIIAGEDLLGVLNLESFLPNAFHPIYAKSLWFAVGQAAVAYRLSRQADINTRLKNLSNGLLELCEESVNKKAADFTLDKLAQMATDHLRAARCDIWRYTNEKFEQVGISHSEFQPEPPRSSGLSNFIRTSKQAVWLTKIEGDANFSAHCWSNKTWNQDYADKKLPNSLNPSVTKNGVEALLGIPIMVRGQCSGVAWLEYRSSREPLPSNEFMKLANGFAAHAGLVIEFSRVDLVEKDAVQEIGRTLSDNLLAQGSLDFDGFPRIEGYVKSNPYSSSSIGGDFYAARVIDEQTACVLLGDGEGHAVKGALHMLPMLTVFETFWNESRSATHIMDKIMSVANKIGVRGTAIYCVFSIINRNLWLLATAAGHDPMVLFNKNGVEKLPPQNSPADGPMLGVPLIKSPLAEEHRELSSGDLIILCTDGLDLNPDEIGSIGLSHKRDSLDVIANAVFEKALIKRKPKPFDDDVTVLIIRVK